MLNSISIAGRLTRDPELRYTQSQVAVCSYSVAVERDYADQSGSRSADFFDCVAWRQAGEFVSKYFHKGDMIVVTGRMQSRDWTDNQGNKRRNWEIQVEHSYFGGSKSDSQSSGQSYGSQGGGYYAQQGQYQGGGRTATSPPDVTPSPYEELDDDGELPFD